MTDGFDFIEQAEFLDKNDFLSNVAEHPNQAEILKKIKGLGAKLISGPRGCGKSTLLLQAYYDLLEDKKSEVVPVYVNYKNSLRLEPLYVKEVKASYIFKKWLIFNIMVELDKSFSAKFNTSLDGIVNIAAVKKILDNLQLNNFEEAENLLESGDFPSLEEVFKFVTDNSKVSRIVLFMDDAAHAFSVLFDTFFKPKSVLFS